MRSLIFISVILAWASGATAQLTKINLRLIDEAGNAVTDCNIKITGNHTGLIYSFFTMGASSVLKKEIELAGKDDSLLVMISQIGYVDTTLRYPAGKQGVLATVRMKLKMNFLKDVRIKAPPIWKQGDTTNFRADAFKQGGEKKLKDIIQNLPGFTIAETGELLYKNRRITRILVDGDEIFAEKIKLMLNSFPAQVIELLQLQENQNENKLLKGGTETVLNLTLKKGTFRAAFGDFEAGIGNKGRYQASPVLFSLNKQIKVGYIGKISSLGDGLGWNTISEIKSAAESQADVLQPQNNSLRLIPNMPEKYYLKNRLFDNRFDFNTRLSGKLTVKTVVSIIADKEPQETFVTNNYFSGTDYTSRTEKWNTVAKPNLINIGQTYNYDINSVSNLMVKTWWFADYGHSYGNTVYHQGDSISFLNDRTTNNRNSFNILGRYTHLDQHKMATVTSVQYNWQRINQSSRFYSAQWPQIFQLADPAYNTLYQRPDYISSAFRIEQLRYFKIGKYQLTESISFKNSALRLAPSVNLSDTPGNLASFSPAAFNLTGDYVRNSLMSATNGFFKTGPDRKIDYSLNFGLDRTRYEETNLRKTITQPEIGIRVGYTPKVFKSLNDNVDLEITVKPPDFFSLGNIFLPQTSTTYRRFAFTSQAVKTFTVGYNCSIQWKEDLTATHFYLYYARHFNNVVMTSTYSDYFNVNTDSLTNRGTNAMMFRMSNTVPSLLLNAVIVFDAEIAYTPYLFYYKQDVRKSVNTQGSAKLSIKKNWNKKYYIVLSGSYSYTGNYRPQLDRQEATNTRLDNLLYGLKQRLIVSKYISLGTETQWTNNNFRSSGAARFLLLDTELNWKVKKTPLTVTLRGENLTDRKSFIVAYNYATGQSTTTVPLIGRNFFAAIRLEL